MKKQILVGLIAALLVILTVFPTLASNDTNEDFSNFVVAGNGSEAIYQSSRVKTDASPIYYEIFNMTYYSVRIKALGTTHSGGDSDPITVSNAENCTCSIYDWEIPWPYVLCLEDVDYSIHSSINEKHYSRASFSCINVYTSYTYITGRWSSDSIYSHTDAYYPN